MKKDESRNLDVASEDIRVFKTLKVRGSEITTPFKSQSISFNDDGVAVQTENTLSGYEISKNPQYLYYYKGNVEPQKIPTTNIDPLGIAENEVMIGIEQGVHSLGYYRTWWDNSASHDGPFYNFLAVIPKGARYMKGSNGNYVSDKLIIFMNDEAYDKYVKKNS